MDGEFGANLKGMKREAVTLKLKDYKYIFNPDECVWQLQVKVPDDMGDYFQDKDMNYKKAFYQLKKANDNKVHEIEEMKKRIQDMEQRRDHSKQKYERQEEEYAWEVVEVDHISQYKQQLENLKEETEKKMKKK